MAFGSSIIARLGLDQKPFQNGLKQATRSAKVFGNNLKSVFAVFGVTLAVRELARFTRATIGVASELSDLAKQGRIGAESLQGLMEASRDAGVNTEILTRALRNVNLRTEEAKKGVQSYKEAFDGLGLEINEFAKLNTEQRFEAIARAVATASNQYEAMALSAKILGEEAGPKLIEVLERVNAQGVDGLVAGIKEAGQLWDDELLARVDEWEDAIQRSFDKLQKGFGNKILKPFFDLEDVIVKAGVKNVFGVDPDNPSERAQDVKAAADARQEAIENTRQLIAELDRAEAEFKTVEQALATAREKALERQLQGEAKLASLREKAANAQKVVNDNNAGLEERLRAVDTLTKAEEDILSTERQITEEKERQAALDREAANQKQTKILEVINRARDINQSASAAFHDRSASSLQEIAADRRSADRGKAQQILEKEALAKTVRRQGTEGTRFAGDLTRQALGLRKEIGALPSAEQDPLQAYKTALKTTEQELAAINNKLEGKFTNE